MQELNEVNGANLLSAQITKQLLTEFDGPLVGCEMGIAYAGSIERIAKLWKERGVIYGFDTFEGHPKQVADVCKDTVADGGQASLTTNCMDPWYNTFGVSMLSYDYIRGELDSQNLNNAILVKGLITDKTEVPFTKLHYCFLDLDFPLSMRQAFALVKDKLVTGGYLCMHDVVPAGHLRGLNEFYQEILKEGQFEVYGEHPGSYLAILKKK